MTDTGVEHGIFARVQASLDALAGSHERLRREVAGARPPQPIYRPLQMAAKFPASGVLAMNLGGPDMGRLWHVRSIAVGGVTPTTTEAGRADVFVSGAPPVSGAPASGDQPSSPGFQTGSALARGSLAGWRDQATALPLPAFYSPGQLVVTAGYDLWVVFSNGTSGDLLQANAMAEEVVEAAYRIEVGL